MQAGHLSRTLVVIVPHAPNEPPHSNVTKKHSNWNVYYSCGCDIKDGHISSTCPWDWQNHHTWWDSHELTHRVTSQGVVIVAPRECTRMCSRCLRCSDMEGQRVHTFGKINLIIWFLRMISFWTHLNSPSLSRATKSQLRHQTALPVFPN